MKRKPFIKALQGPVTILLMIGIILLLAHSMGNQQSFTPETLSYSELLGWVETDLRLDLGQTVSENEQAHTIKKIIIQDRTLYGLKQNSQINDSSFGNAYDFSCILPSSAQFYSDVNSIYGNVLGDEHITPTAYRFEITSKLPQGQSWLVEWLPMIIMMGLLIFFWFMMLRQQAGSNGRGVMNFGRSRARLTDPSGNKATFKDVAGAEEEKEELREIVQFLKDPARFTSLGARIPSGVLLVGPPGTGKTLLARAVAGEAGVPFFTISGSDFVEMFVGVGASRVRDLFDQAKKAAPAIVFIDEIDAVGRQRGAGLGGGHDEREQTLNQLLVEMDGFTQNQGIIVMAATNRADILDPALLRPGRFDRRITVNYPDLKGREEILKVHSRNKPLAPDVDLHTIARRTPYFTGADLMNVMNEAALLSARNGKSQIDMKTIEDAITRVMAGPEKRSRRVTPADRRLVAYHESGHAIVSYYIPECSKVHEITTIPRGQAGGYTMYLPQEEFSFITTARLNAEMASLMGGRVAEAIIFGDISTGASSDIKRATEIARQMVTEYGMSDKLGPIYLGSEREVFLGRSFSQQSADVSERVSSDIDTEVHRLIQGAYDRAHDILSEHREQLDGLAALLIDREKLDGRHFEQFMQGLPIEGEDQGSALPAPPSEENDGTEGAWPLG